MSVLNPVIDRIDGPSRRIFLRQGVVEWNPVDDIYKEVRDLRLNDPSLRRFDMFCEAIPLIEKSPGVFTGRGLVLLLGTRIVPFDETATQTITGELLSDAGQSGPELIDLTSLSVSSKVKINYAPPPATEIVSGGSGGGGLLPDEREALFLARDHARAANMQTKSDIST